MALLHAVHAQWWAVHSADPCTCWPAWHVQVVVEHAWHVQVVVERAWCRICPLLKAQQHQAAWAGQHFGHVPPLPACWVHQVPLMMMMMMEAACSQRRQMQEE